MENKKLFVRIISKKAGANNFEKGVWWEVDLEEIREHFDECKANGANPHLENVSFEDYTCALPPFSLYKLSKYNGSHFIYGEVDALSQIDHSPIYFLCDGILPDTPAGDKIEWTCEVFWK